MALYLPEVTVKYVDWLIDQAKSEPQSDHENCKWINNLQEVVQQQQRELRKFFLTVDALHNQYQERYQRYNELSHKLKQEFSENNSSMKKDEQLNKNDKELLDFLEQQLHYWRNHATEHRDKKAKLEQQYHQAYFIPVVNTHYQRKYIQARNKTNEVEQRLSDLHHTMDFVKDRLKQHLFSITARLNYHHTLQERQRQFAMDMDKLQKLMVEMKQAQSFWCQFDTQHIQPYLNFLLCRQVKEVDQAHNLSDRIRQLTLEYEHAQYYGLVHYWNHHVTWDVNFVCAQCHHTNCLWPCLSQQAAQLLCNSCYQYNKSQKTKTEASLPMIVDPQPQEKPPPPPTSNFSTSMPSLVLSWKPLIKKVKSVVVLKSKLDFLAYHPILASRYLYRSLLS